MPDAVPRADPERPAAVASRADLPGRCGGSAAAAAGTPVTFSTAAFDPLLGMSAQQFGLLARSHHRSQTARQMREDPGTGEATFLLVDEEPKARSPRRGNPRRPRLDPRRPRPLHPERGGASRVPGSRPRARRSRAHGSPRRLRRPLAGAVDSTAGPRSRGGAQDLGRRGAKPSLRSRAGGASLPPRRPGAFRLGGPRARSGPGPRSAPRRRHGGRGPDLWRDPLRLEPGPGAGDGGRRQPRSAHGLVGVEEGRRGPGPRARPVAATALRR